MASSLTTILLNKSLTTMVKGIRAAKDRGEQEYIQQCLAEIKNEVQSGYADVKTMALRKLIYLQMVGYDMSWASFRVIEVMSASWFGHKRVGYLSAALSFTKDTDVILLATHLFRKAFTQNVSTDSATTEGLKYETGAALSCLASICTPDLAQDLLSDLYGMMNSTQPYLRKKATLVLLKVFQQWPKALRLSFDRLKEKLNDENQGVVSAAVYVICELAAKNPKNYLALAPQFFKILTTSSNNWVLIKVVKLLGSLVPLEPRLAKKLTEPLTDIINTTPAKSLLYECVNTLLSGELKSKAVIRLCLDKLKTFIEDPDQNLKYLGLLGLHKLMRAHPVVVSEHKDLILDCLRDDDVTIRQRALDLVTSMVSKRNIAGIVRRLIEHLNVSDGAYRENVLERIIHICSQENFAYVHDFEWYLTTLIQLTELFGVSRANAQRIKQQLMDVVIRVPAVRRFGVRAMSDLLVSNRLLASDSNAMSEVLYACAWSVGEFAEYVTDHLDLVQVMLKATVAGLPPYVQIVFVQSVLKVYASGLAQQTIDEKDNRVLNLPTATGTSAVVNVATPAPATPGAPATPTAAAGGGAATSDILSFDILNKLPASPGAAAPAAAGAGAGAGAGAADGAAAVDAKKADDKSDDAKDSKKAAQPEKVAKKRSFAEWSVFVDQMNDAIVAALPLFTRSHFVEVQERAVAYLNFMTWIIGKDKEAKDAAKDAADKKADAAAPAAGAAAKQNAQPPESAEANAARKQRLLGFVAHFVGLFSEPLSVVNKKAQRAVPVPDGLDLDKEIHAGAWAEVDEDEKDSFGGGSGSGGRGGTKDDDGYSLRIEDEEPAAKKKLTPAEIEEAKKRVAAAEARRAHDPFYIKSKPAKGDGAAAGAGGVSQADLDKIPTKELDDIGGSSVKVNSSGSGSGKKGGFDDDAAPAKPAKTYTVIAVEEMPKGFKAEPKAAAKGKGKAAADSDDDVDLTTPLGADEVIPRAMTYAEKKAIADKKRAEDDAKAAAAKAADDKDKKKKHKKGDKEKDKEKEKDKKHKHKHKDGAAAAAAAAAPAAAAPAGPTATGNVLDFFDPLTGLGAGKPAAPKAAAAPAAAIPAAAAAAGAGADADDKAKAKKKSSKSSSSASEGATLRSGSSYSVKYVVKHNSSASAPASGASALVLLNIKSKSSSVTALDVAVAHSAKVKVIGTAKDATSDKGVVVTIAKPAKGETEKRMLQFDWVGGVLTVPAKLTVIITATDSKGKHKNEAELVLHAGAFVVPQKCSAEEFEKVQKLPQLCSASAANVALGSSIGLGEALDVVAAALNVAQVEAAAFTAKFCGRFASDRSPVLVVVRGKKEAPSSVAVDIRAGKQETADQLLRELVAALK